MAVTENDITLFKRIEDIFPLSSEECYKFYLNNSDFITLYNYIKQILDYIGGNNYQLLGNYITKYSQRTLSMAVKKNMQWYGISNYNGVYLPSIPSISILSSTIYNLYKPKWSRIAEDFNLKYDVLKPLQMDSSYDTITDHMETTSNSDNSRNKSGTSADNNETEYDNTDNKIYGFNSVDGVNSDSSKNTSKDNSNGTFSSSDTYKGTDTYSRDANSKKTVTRSGNIGNRLPSEMLLKEIEFRKNMLKDIIANDINSVLTRSKYI